MDKNKRIKLFIKNLLGDIKINKSNIREKLYDIYTNDMFVSLLLENYGIDMNSQEIYKANYDAFSDLIFKNIS